MPDALASASNSVPKVPKRAQIACTYCRRRKLKCISPGDESPCDRCKTSGKDCHYEPVNPPAGDSHPFTSQTYPPPPMYPTVAQGDIASCWNASINLGSDSNGPQGFPPSNPVYPAPSAGHHPPLNPTSSPVGQPLTFPPTGSIYPQTRYPPPNAHPPQQWPGNPTQPNPGANPLGDFYGHINHDQYPSSSQGGYPGSGGGMAMSYSYYSQSSHHDRDHYGHSGGK